MYDQSYSSDTLSSLMRRGDFHRVPVAVRDMLRDATADAAAYAAATVFCGANPITKFHLKKKPTYRIRTLWDDLVVRKLARNVKALTRNYSTGRAQLVSNLCEFLLEGVPYRIYRLDVRSFYESFSHDELLKKANGIHSLSPLSLIHLKALVEHYTSLGGTGLPRGMAVSAVLSDMMMSGFDEWVLNHPAVYFYGRYVDDIVVITNRTEDQTKFTRSIQEKLPVGLFLNKKKVDVREATEVKKSNGATRKLQFTVDYLGYRFSVYDPFEADNSGKETYRYVQVDIAPAKVKRMKLRIVRTLRDFVKTKDATLLIDRIKFLTSNFSIIDKNTGTRQLAGIYYGYPQLSNDCESLKELDRFLRTVVLSKKGRVFGMSYHWLPSRLKRRIFGHSFQQGHSTKRFLHFSTPRIHDIQECWRHQ